MENVFNNQKERKFSYVVFVVYLFLLCWLVLFKFATSMEAIPHIRGINLIPFHYDMENSVHLKEVIYNIIVFIPCGVYLSAFFQEKYMAGYPYNFFIKYGIGSITVDFYDRSQRYYRCDWKYLRRNNRLKYIFTYGKNSSQE